MPKVKVPYRPITKIDEDHYLVPSDSDPDLDYRVWMEHGVWSCSCRGFLLTCIKRGTNCRHLTRLFLEHPEIEGYEFVNVGKLKAGKVRITNALGVEI